MLPVVDVVEVGAGGGSIAWIDDVGALKVGPQSAGADPGPIGYGKRRQGADHHGRQCRARPHRRRDFLGGQMRLDRGAAARGIEEKIATPLRHGVGRGRAGHRRDRDREDVARGARGVGREGLRPARLRPGGVGRRRAAPCLAIARELHIPKVIVPLFPSHFSALGMLLADERHDFIRTLYCDLPEADFARFGDP